MLDNARYVDYLRNAPPAAPARSLAMSARDRPRL
jgi:hypothetical protein